MGRHVLIVDDEPHLLAGLERALRKESFQILSATCAEEALKILRTHSIDVVISDQNMPGMNGTVFLTMVRQSYPDTVRFMLTGKATLDVAIEAINHGAITRFFTKPCNPLELAVSIRQALQQKDLLAMARKLLNKVKHQSSFIEELEKRHPGITKVKRDASGSIVMETMTDDFEGLLREIHEVVE